MTAFGSRLLGSHDESERRRRVRVQVLLTASIVVANVFGTLGVSALIVLLVPDRGPADWQTALAGGVYLVVAVIVGLGWGTRTGLASLRWMVEGREPDALEQRRTLRVPIRLVRVQAVFWVVGAAFFALLNNDLARGGGLKVGLTVFLGGIVTCAIAYLLSEFAMRPIAAQALAVHPPDRLHVPGVQSRTLLAWATGSAIPVVGLIIGALFALADESISRERLAVTILVLGGVTLVVGLLLISLATRATVDPIRSVRAALARVETGDLDVQVPVYDGTEVGLLQAGFNVMVGGLQERERIRYLFERHVGEDVARDAMGREASLSGEVRQVAVLFVDVVGSTRLASELPPTEVVALLNRFFSVVVDVVGENGGLVNKLVGDAVLAVWGAPGDVDDAAGRALAAARQLGRRLARAVPELTAGVGVAAGEAVAGNIGDERRFEYTVIGNPVNEAARLTELAKTLPGRVVASMAAVDLASSVERARWQAHGSVDLRGRPAPTAIARPREIA
ncbi:MAG: adenylate/guanylate cyclase domain-containing protein [Acidimicrobiales bacterium]